MREAEAGRIVGVLAWRLVHGEGRQLGARLKSPVSRTFGSDVFPLVGGREWEPQAGEEQGVGV